MQHPSAQLRDSRTVPLWELFSAMFQALRPLHWLKNGLVLAPLLFSRSFHDANAVAGALWAFLAFSLVASTVYLLNDARDTAADRNHSGKRHRPLAAGTLSARYALLLMVILTTLAVMALTQIPGVAPYLFLYSGINVAYSLGLKQIPWLDLAILTLGFVLRVYAGAAAIAVEPSAWMLTSTFALALYMASLKRHAELQAHGPATRAALMHYRPEQLRTVAWLAGAVAVGSYGLFSMLVRPGLAFTLAPVMLGVVRYGWLVIYRQGGDSPFVLIARDSWLLLVVAFWAIATIISLW